VGYRKVRIPNINQTGVPSAEQLSLGAISSAAQAKMRTTATLTKVVSDYQTKVQTAEREAELHSASIGLEKDSQELIQSITDQDSYGPDGNAMYGNIMPQFESGMDDIIKKHGDGLTYSDSKNAYMQSSDIYRLQMSGKMNGLYRNRQTEHLQGELTKNLIHYETDLENGLARAEESIASRIAGSVITSATGETKLDQFRAKWQFNVTVSDFELQRAEGLEEGEAFLEAFSENPPDSMPVDEQVSLKSRMNTLLNQDRAVAKAESVAIIAAEKVRQKSLEGEGKAMADQLKGGFLITNKFITSYTEIANQITDTNVKKSMAQALAWSHELREAVGTSSMAELYQMGQRALIPADTLEESEHNEFIADGISKAMNLVKTDPQSAAVQMGLVKPQINTLQDGLDAGDLRSFVNEMDARKQRIDEVWGIDSALFSDADTNILSQAINQKSSGFLGELVNNLGKRSYDVLEKLLGKVSNDKVILGTLMAQGKDGEAAVAHVINGIKVKAAGAKIPSTADMSIPFNERFNSGLYPQGDANFKMGMLANVRHAYVSLSSDHLSTDLNEETLDEAMDLVMQEPVEMATLRGIGWSNKYFTFPPRRNMTKKEVIGWKNSLPASTFESITGVPNQEIFIYDEVNRQRGYSDLSQATGTMGTQSSAEYIKQLVANNELELTYFGEQGRYYLMWNNQTLMSGDEPFVLEYKE
jgi:hypothetical protein